MAWVSTDLTADQIARAADDKPLVGVRNVLDYATSIVWKNLGGTVASSNGDEARAHDGKSSLATSPATSSTTRTLHVAFPSGGPPAFDFVSVLMDSNAFLTQIRFDIADDSLYSVRYEQGVADITASATTVRASDLKLGDSGDAAPNSYSGVEFMRILFNLSGSSTVAVREIFIGSRVQLANHPERPYDSYGNTGNTVIHEAHSGDQSRYVMSKGKRNVAANLRPWKDADAADIASIYTLSDYGNAPLIWIDEPTTAPNDFNLMHFRNPSLALPHVGPNERNITLDFEEQGPHYQALE